MNFKIKKVCLWLAFVVAVIIIMLVFKNIKGIGIVNDTEKTKEIELNPDGVKYNGWLKTNGYKLENEKGEQIQLRGLSSHGIEWFSEVVTYNNLKELKDNWKINVFRIAIYTDENGSGYVSNKEETTKKIYKIIDDAIDLDMYVIVDWHILKDNNPQIHKEEAKTFFSEISEKYSDVYMKFATNQMEMM